MKKQDWDKFVDAVNDLNKKITFDTVIAIEPEFGQIYRHLDSDRIGMLIFNNYIVDLSNGQSWAYVHLRSTEFEFVANSLAIYLRTGGTINERV